MKIHVHAIHFSADNSLVTFIQKKLDKLETFYDRIIGGDVFLRLDKGDKKDTHKKQIEIKLNVPGNIIFVKETADTFEAATDVAMNSLTRQVKEHKDKMKIKGREKQELITEPLEEDDL